MKKQILIFTIIGLIVSLLFVLRFNDIQKHLYAKIHNITVKDVPNLSSNCDETGIFGITSLQRGNYKICLDSEDIVHEEIFIEIINLPKDKIVHQEKLNKDTQNITVYHGSWNDSFLGQLLIKSANGEIIYSNNYWIFGWER